MRRSVLIKIHDLIATKHSYSETHRAAIFLQETPFTLLRLELPDSTKRPLSYEEAKGWEQGQTSK